MKSNSFVNASDFFFFFFFFCLPLYYLCFVRLLFLIVKGCNIIFFQGRSQWGEKNVKIGKKKGKEGKNWEEEEKSGIKGKNRGDTFTLPLLTDRAGYATAFFRLLLLVASPPSCVCVFKCVCCFDGNKFELNLNGHLNGHVIVRSEFILYCFFFL